MLVSFTFFCFLSADRFSQTDCKLFVEKTGKEILTNCFVKIFRMKWNAISMFKTSDILFSLGFDNLGMIITSSIC